MLKRKVYFILLIMCCTVYPLYGKSTGFKEVEKQKYNTDTIHTYRHKTSGLEVIWIENKDTNKSFVLGVKTPTTNSTGVNHIIEHTLFTGSKDYPSSSLFFDASAAYPNTYMNALTSGDMTIFPFATPYGTCYEQLLHIYLDAIFRPDFLEHPYGFYEEAFHLSPEENRVGGVVYNEMKGAYSSKERTIFRSLRNFIFKDSHYAYDSGGAPNEIPTLTYEACLETYKAYYYPANMKIILYGDLPIEESLKTIEGYVKDAQYPKEGVDLCVQSLNEVTKATYRTLPEKNTGCLVKSFVVDSGTSVQQLQALDLWMSVYLMNRQSGFGRALQAYGMGQVKWVKDEDLPYTVYSLMISELPPEEEKLEQYAQLLDRLIESIPPQMEVNTFAEKDILSEANWYILKQDTGVQRGINISQSILDGWAHGRALNQYYTKMNYIQKAISLDHNCSKLLLKEAKRYTLLLLPGSYEIVAPETLTPLSQDEWLTILPSMKKWQKQKVQLKGINLEELVLEPKVKMEVNYPSDYTQLVTRIGGKWARSQLYFNIAHVPQEELPYLFLYAHLLEESANEIAPFSGLITTQCTACPKGEAYCPYLKLSILTKAGEVQHSTLLNEARINLQNKPDAWYKQKLDEWIVEIKSNSQNNVISTLSQLALGCEGGMKRYLYEQSYPTYQFCRALSGLLPFEWTHKIKEMDDMIYQKEGLIVATAIPNKKGNPYMESWEPFIKALPTSEVNTASYTFSPLPKTSILKGQGSVDYSYIGFSKPNALDGVDYLAGTFLTKNYLNPKIRVMLGAYGTGCQIRYPSTIALYTYRDPDFNQSQKFLQKAYDFLEKPIAKQLLENSKAEALSRIHEQFKLLGTPLEQANTLESLWLWGEDEMAITKLQQEVIKATPQSLCAKAKIYSALIKKGATAVMTPKNYTEGQEYTTYCY